MAWTDLTITRADINAVEGATFELYDADTTLAIASNDEDVLAMAKSQLEDDIIRRMDNATYTEDGLLDALYEADTRDLLMRMLLYKFLANWFFQDASKEDSLSYAKYREWTGNYYRSLNDGLSGLASKLSTPRNPARFRIVR